MHVSLALTLAAVGSSRRLRTARQFAHQREQNRQSQHGAKAQPGGMQSGILKCAPCFMHGQPPWQHVAWPASALGASSPYLVSQLLNLAGFTNDRHGKRVLGTLVDLRLQIRGHLQQVGTFARNLLLLRLFGASGGWFFLLAGGGWCAGNFLRSRSGPSRRRLRMTAQQTGARRNSKCGATCQQTELPAAASKPALGPRSASAMPALHGPQHGTKNVPEEPARAPAIPAHSLV